MFGADPASQIVATVAEAHERLASHEAETAGNEVVQIGALGDAIVAIEPMGWAGSDETVACELSKGGRCAALLVSAYSTSMFVYAAGGELVRSFPVGLYGGELDLGDRLPEEEGLAFDDEFGDHYAAALLLIERLTGARLDREWVLEGRRPAYRRAANGA